jgi:hypothetical protein
LAVGDIGILRRDRFEHLTSLDRLGIQLQTKRAGYPFDLEYTSKGSVDIALNTAASAQVVLASVPSGSADSHLSITFTRANAVVFMAKDCQTTGIVDRAALAAELIERYRAGNWQAELAVVTEVVSARATTILISAAAGAWIDFAAKASAQLEPSVLVDGSAGLRVSGASGIGTKIISRRGLTPLFQASGLRRRFLSQPRLATRSEDQERSFTNGNSSDLVFSDIVYDDGPSTAAESP